MATDEPILIKRYANRKLYDQSRSRYVTLEELEEFIRQGREIRVVDAVSGEDLTEPDPGADHPRYGPGPPVGAAGRVPAPAHPARHRLADVRPGIAPVEPLGNRGQPAGDRAGAAGLGGAGGLVAVGAREARRRPRAPTSADAAGLKAEVAALREKLKDLESRLGG